MTGADEPAPGFEDQEDPAGPDGPGADPEAVAREIALRLLTVRARSRAELARALAKKQVPAAVAERVLVRLTEVGLVDDEAFASSWLESGARRHKSRRALLAELSEKGVAGEVIETAVAELDAEHDYEVARSFAAKKLPGLARVEPQARYRRLAGALARRGFSGGVVARVTRESLAEFDAQDGLQTDWDGA